ncbi:MAG: DUF2232 domain-containing protein [Syntrophomonadaceae bacterium]|nr:DUF2232 domain-containing protein [Syntrophomonadaceae bacterium]
MLILGILTAVIAVLMAVWPEMCISLSLFWGIILLIGSYYVRRYELILAMVAGLLLFFFGQGVSQLLLLALLNAPAFVMAWLGCENDDARSAAGWYAKLRRWCVITAMLAGLLYLGIGAAGIGPEGYDAFTAEMESEIMAGLDDASMQQFWDAYAERGVDTAALQEMIPQVFRVMMHLLPAVFALMFTAFSLFVLVIARMFLRVRFQNALDKPPFFREIMPLALSGILMVGLILALLGGEQENLAFYGGLNILLLMLPFTVYYGLAGFSRIRRKVSAGTRVLITVVLIAALLFLTPLALAVLAGMGILAPLFHRLAQPDNHDRIIEEEDKGGSA